MQTCFRLRLAMPSGSFSRQIKSGKKAPDSNQARSLLAGRGQDHSRDLAAGGGRTGGQLAVPSLVRRFSMLTSGFMRASSGTPPSPARVVPRREFLSSLPLLSLPAPALGQPNRQPVRRLLIDSDAANYFDDQFAISYAARSSEAVVLEAVYAAPFSNSRVSDPGGGMLLSLAEVSEVLGALGLQNEVAVRAGARQHLGKAGRPVESPAAEDIISRTSGALPANCVVVSLGPPTNVASALLMDPSLARRITVVWLGGTPHDFSTASEFNLRQDPQAVRVLLDSGVPLLHVPAQGVAEDLSASRALLESRLASRSAIGDLLLERVIEHWDGHQVPPGSPAPLAIWDMAAIAALVVPDLVEVETVPSPLLGQGLRWRTKPGRHPIRVARRIAKDAVMADFFAKLHLSPD